MIEVHESPFVDGSEDLQAIQEELAKNDPVTKALVDKVKSED